jgi:maleate cis-trans isomerase
MPTKALLIVPANNTTMEPEIAALCPELDTILVARVRRPMRTLSAEDMAGYGEATIEAVAPFISERPDIVVTGARPWRSSGPGATRTHRQLVIRQARR